MASPIGGVPFSPLFWAFIIPSLATFLIVIIIMAKLNLPLDPEFLKDRNDVSLTFVSLVPRIGPCHGYC